MRSSDRPGYSNKHSRTTSCFTGKTRRSTCPAHTRARTHAHTHTHIHKHTNIFKYSSVIFNSSFIQEQSLNFQTNTPTAVNFNLESDVVVQSAQHWCQQTWNPSIIELRSYRNTGLSCTQDKGICVSLHIHASPQTIHLGVSVPLLHKRWLKTTPGR